MKLFLSSKITLILIFFVAINIYPLAIENANAEEKGCRYLYTKDGNASYTKCLETACGKGILRACGDLGYDYSRRNFSAGNDKYKQGIQLVKNSCDKGVGAFYCKLIGAIYFLDKRNVNIAMGFEYLLKSCKLDSPSSCSGYINMFTGLPKILRRMGQNNYTPDIKVYQGLYEVSKKMCDQGIKNDLYCEGLGIAYENGYYVQKDTNKALAAYLKGCNLEEYGSCERLSVLYKEGKYVERNLELSKKYEALVRPYLKIYRNNAKAQAGDIGHEYF